MTKANAEPDDLERLLAFWFSERARARWFEPDPAFDRDVREAFLPLYHDAANGGLVAWRETPCGCLGLVLLLDQVPRNVFRDQPRAYATDAQAREVAAHALARGFDLALGEEERGFLYMPFQHSEDPEDQERSVRLFETLDGDPRWAESARRHRDIVARFARFPHRNAVLGRSSTPQEAAFLAEHGRGF